MSEHKLNPFAKQTNVVLPPQLRDAAGRVLKVGDQILIIQPKPPLFMVTDISPVLDPGQPANLMDITIMCRARFRAVRDEKCGEFLRVLTVDELPQTPQDKEPVQ